MGFSRQEYWSGVPLPSPKKVMRYTQKQEKINILVLLKPIQNSKAHILKEEVINVLEFFLGGGEKVRTLEI